MKNRKLYYLASGDVRKGRVEAILYMRECEWFSNLGFDVTLLSGCLYNSENISRADIFQYYGIDQNFTVKIVPMLLTLKTTWRLWWRLNYFLGFLIYLLPVFLKREKCIIYTKGRVCMEAALLLERLTGWRTIKVFETHSVDDSPGLFRVLKRMDLVVANSKAVQRILIEKGIVAENVVQVYNAPFTQGEIVPKEMARQILDMPMNRNLLVYAGKLYDKIVKFIVSVAKRLKPYNIEILVVGGNKSILRRAQGLIKKSALVNLSFVGFQPPSSVGLWLSASDYLFCSYSSNVRNIEQATPAKYFDYMYAHRPIFCSRNTAIQELFNDRENCIYFTPESSDDFVDQLLNHMNDKALLDKIVRNNDRLIHSLGWESRMRHVVRHLELRISDGRQ